jgi:SnoaL-like domain
MSQENVEIVRGLFAALESQDWEAALGVFDPEVEWSPTEGTFHGPEGVVRSLAEWLEPWEEHNIEAEEFREVGDKVLAIIRLTGLVRAAGWRSISGSFRSTPYVTARSSGWSGSLGVARPSKPPGFRSRRCRRRTWKAASASGPSASKR